MKVQERHLEIKIALPLNLQSRKQNQKIDDQSNYDTSSTVCREDKTIA